MSDAEMFSHVTVATLEGYLNCYQNVELRGDYDQTKFERIQFTNIWINIQC